MKNSKQPTISALMRRLSELYEFNRRLKSFKLEKRDVSSRTESAVKRIAKTPS